MRSGCHEAMGDNQVRGPKEADVENKPRFFTFLVPVLPSWVPILVSTDPPNLAPSTTLQSNVCPGQMYP